jgi:hypothetical protein
MTKQRKNLGGAFRSSRGFRTKSELQRHMLEKQYFKKTIQNLVIYDGKFYPHLQTIGMNPGHPLHQSFINDVVNLKLPWRIWLGVFESNGDRVWVSHHVYNSDGMILERTNDLSDDIEKMLKILIETSNQKHVISWAWFAVVADVDMIEAAEDMKKLFIRDGAFNKTLCDSVHQSRSESEKIYGLVG